MSSPTKPFLSSLTIKVNLLLLGVGLILIVFTEKTEVGMSLVGASLANMKLRERTSAPIAQVKVGK